MRLIWLGAGGLAVLLAAGLVLLRLPPGVEQAANEAIDRMGGGPAAPATAGRNLAAEALLAQAQQAANTGRDGLAREAYERALGLYQSAGDMAGQGTALLGLATLTRYTGQGEVSRGIYARALAAFEQAGDAVGQAKVVFAIAELERARFNNQEALAGFGRAASMFRLQGEWGMEGHSLLGVADAERRLGRIVTADGTIARARAIFEIVGDRAGQQAAMRTHEELATYVDENDETRLKFAYDLNYADQGGSRLLEANANLGMGRLEVAAGRPAQARAYLAEAQGIYREMRLANGEFDALAELGNLERRLGYLADARETYARALAAYERARERDSREAQQFEETAIAPLAVRAALLLAAMGELEVVAGGDGKVRLDAARALIPAGDPRIDGAVTFGRAIAEEKAGRTDVAAAMLAEAEQIYSLAGLALGAAQAQLAHADVERSRGTLPSAQVLYSRAIESFLAARDRIGEAVSRWGLARALAPVPAEAMEANIQYRIAARIFAELGQNSRATAATAAAQALPRP